AKRQRIGEVGRSQHLPRPRWSRKSKASDRARIVRRDAEIPGDDARAGIGHCRGGQVPEACGLAQGWRGRRHRRERVVQKRGESRADQETEVRTRSLHWRSPSPFGLLMAERTADSLEKRPI